MSRPAQARPAGSKANRPATRSEIPWRLLVSVLVEARSYFRTRTFIDKTYGSFSRRVGLHGKLNSLFRERIRDECLAMVTTAGFFNRKKFSTLAIAHDKGSY